MTASRKRTAVLISGRGSNMAALIAAAAEASYPAEIVAVIADNGEANGLRMAAQNGIPTRVIERGGFADRAAHDDAIDAALGEFAADLVCLAGYMRVLTPAIVEKWRGRMINIHPALLPAFKGMDTHRAALEAGVRIHGCTVHFVTAEADSGPIIAQAAVPVLAGDDERTLAQRVLKAEHQLYPHALALVATGKARMEEGKAVLDADGSEAGAACLLSPALPGAENQAVDLEHLARFTP